MLLLKAPELKTGRVTLKARRTGGREGFLMFFNARDIDRFLFCNYGAAGNGFHAIQDRGSPEGCAFLGGRSTQGRIEDGRWYEISLVVGRDRAEMFLDGAKVSDARMEHLPSFFATAGYRRGEKTVVLRATNYHPQPLRAAIRIEGAETVGAAGEHIVLRADRPEDENTLEEPAPIAPQRSTQTGCATEFTVTLPPLSVNVLRIPAAAR